MGSGKLLSCEEIIAEFNEFQYFFSLFFHLSLDPMFRERERFQMTDIISLVNLISITR
jgi:hypothetical protein